MPTDNVTPMRPRNPNGIPPQELAAILQSAQTRVSQLFGVVGLAKGAVNQEAGQNESLTQAWCALGLALAELRRLCLELEAAQTKGSETRSGLLGDAGTELPDDA